MLLHQQSEISDLEAQLLIDVKADRDDEDVGLQELEVNFFSEHRERSETLEKLLRVREKLEIYSKCCTERYKWPPEADRLPDQSLLKFRQVYNFPRIEKSAFETLRYWFQRPSGGANFLRRHDALNIDPATSFDLVKPLCMKKDQDTLSRFTNEKLIPWLNDKLYAGQDQPKLKVFDPLSRSLQPEPLHYYSDTFIAGAINMFNTVAVYSLTVTPVLALSYVESRAAKNIIIAVFALAFCAIMSLLTTAKRAEHFLALAAFTAVLVVFVGNDGGIESGGD